MKNGYYKSKMRFFNCKKPLYHWNGVLLMMLFSLPVFATPSGISKKHNVAVQQQVEVSGVVTDEMSEPIPGVNVLVKGTNIGTVTDIDGEYRLNIPNNLQDGILMFSYVGFVTEEIPLSGQSVINVQMVADLKALEEVVVVGYGTQKKESLTGAISNTTEKEIRTTTHSSLAQYLQGKVPGLQIRQNSGQPGEFNTNINIRGFGGSPLYVIDGIPRDGSSEFQRLNPQDIESISVLKDASAAIYGVRAANGVIIVTTKKGHTGKAEFNYNGTVGVQRPTNVPEMATASQLAQMRNDASLFGFGSPFYAKEELQRYIDEEPGYESTDWYDVTMRNFAPQYQHNLSATGGTEDIQYFVSLGYLNEEGLLKSGDMGYEKYTFRSNVVANLANNLKGEFLIAGRYDKREEPGENFFNIFKGTRVTLPTEKPYANDNPLYPGLVSSGQNPLALSDRELTGYNEATDKQFQSSIALTYTVPFLEGLSFKGLASYDANTHLNKNLFKEYELFTYSPDEDEYVSHPQRDGSSNISNHNADYNRLTFQAQASFEKQINDRHNINSVIVMEQQSSSSRWSTIRRYYKFYTTDQINFADTERQEANGLESETGRLSYIGRFNYDYNNKYLFEFAIRRDGSYRYHPDVRWGSFPVVSAGWRISEEDFLQNSLPFVSELKMRASYGIVGEDAGAPFQYVPGFSLSGGGGYEFTDGVFTTGISSPSLVNENLTWFKSKITNIGMDLGLWNGRFNLVFDVYQRDREGLLARRNLSLPNTFGGELPEENLNSDRVRGFDMGIGYNDQINDFKYGIGANFNFARTMTVYQERGPFVNSYDRWRSGAAERWNDIVWGFVYEGQFQNEEEILNAPIQNGDRLNTFELPGDFKYKDVNNDGIIDGEDLLPLFWSGTPKMHFGVTLNASWKGFDLNLLVQGSGKYTVRFNEVYAEVMAFNGNTPAYFFDRWHKEDPYSDNSEWVPGKWPASRVIADVGAMYAESSIWRRDASYVRLKSAELGYSLNTGLLNTIGIQGLRIYANAHNLFTIADPFVKPFDPEKIEGLFNAGFTYPLTQSFNFGLNLTF